MKKLNNHEIEQICRYCECASPLSFDEEHVLCSEKGVVKCTSKCRKFVFDPLKYSPVHFKPIEPPEITDL